MSKSSPPKPARPFVNFFFTDDANLEQCLTEMEQFLGQRIFTSEISPFDISDYYVPEMGSGVKRIFTSWRDLIDPYTIVEIKRRAWEIERKFPTVDGGRTVNIDPGLIEEGKFILATGKGSPHRPYMGQGVYVDLTLIYENGSYRPLPWTYPDYKSPQIVAMLNALRAEYLHDRNELKKLENEK